MKKLEPRIRVRVRKNIKESLREKLAGTILPCAIVPLAVLGYLLIATVGTFFNTARARQGVRALDHFVGTSLFNGYAWGSISSHAWRERNRKEWAKIVIKTTDFFQKDRCKKASRRKQPVVDFILSGEPDQQAIGK